MLKDAAKAPCVTNDRVSSSMLTVAAADSRVWNARTQEPSTLTEAASNLQVHVVSSEQSNKFLVDRQKEDPDIGPIIQKLLSPTSRVEFTDKGERLWKIRKNLEVKEGLLVRKYKMNANRRPIEQVVLPENMKEMVLESLHDDIFSGHFGVKKTLSRVKLRYYWPGYAKDVEKWCQTCLVCQRRKSPQSANTPPLQSIDTGQGPFEQIALDILKLPLTERGNQYALVIEDYFSKWVEVFPLQRTAAPSVAQCVLNGWVSRFGCPYSILSDQGQEFESNLFKELNNAMQTSKLRTTAYHPRTDGMVERKNRTLIDVLSKFASQEADWDLKLPLILFAIRTSEHASTGFSPFLLTYGKEARIPWDILYGAPPSQPLPKEQWVASRKKDMENIFEMVKQNTKRSQKHQKEYYDRNRKCKFQSFETGDLVMLCDPAARVKDGKLNSPWSGPLKILEKLSDALYRLELKDGKDKIVNTERLKKFYPRYSSNMPAQPGARNDTQWDSDDEHSLVDDAELINLNEERDNQHPGTEAEQQNLGNELRDAPVPIMGHRGELWCNNNPQNVLQTRLRPRN